MNTFSTDLINWQKKYGRHDLPWQKNIHAYSVWVSEIMLQQTQVATVINYYQRFIQRFPTVLDLANADEDSVFTHWAGLGYYQRARNLHRTSKIIVRQYDGIFPLCPDALVALPGIGKSTAHAICSIVGGHALPILDANAKRVIMRYHNMTEDPSSAAIKKTLWDLAQQHVPQQNCRQYTQGIMDLGAQVCTKKPHCDICPVQSGCKAHHFGDPEKIPLKQKRPKKPERFCYLVWYQYDDAFFMQKRPEKGIWANLWCPIEYTSRPNVPNAAKLVELPQLKHIFTHFILYISPMIIQVGHQSIDYMGKWVPREALQTLAVPAAVKKIQRHLI